MGNEDFEEMLLRKLIRDLTSDKARGPPDSFLILFYPYFVMNLKTPCHPKIPLEDILIETSDI